MSTLAPAIAPEALSQRGSRSGHSDFVVLFLCVDHRSRSILAERMARHAAERIGLSNVRFLGVGGHKTHPGAGIDPATAVELSRRGLDGGSASPRRLDAHQLATADLVLTFEREHRTEVYQFAPRMLEHCFSLTELAAISRAAPELQPHSRPPSRAMRVREASRLRHLAQDTADVPQTWRQPAPAHRAAARMIAADLGEILGFLQ